MANELAPQKLIKVDLFYLSVICVSIQINSSILYYKIFFGHYPLFYLIRFIVFLFTAIVMN